MKSNSLETVAVREVEIRYRGRSLKSQAPISRPDHFVHLARRIVSDHAREHFIALYLDGRHRPAGHSVVSVGTATASLVHPREVFQSALLLGAVALVIGHNHPSGDPRPSAEDQQITDRLSEAGSLLGVRLVDHVIWTREGGYHSFLEQGTLPKAP